MICQRYTVCGGCFRTLGGLPVSQSQDVAHHGHDGQGAGVVGPPVEPHLGGGDQGHQGHQGHMLVNKVCVNLSVHVLNDQTKSINANHIIVNIAVGVSV